MRIDLDIQRQGDYYKILVDGQHYNTVPSMDLAFNQAEAAMQRKFNEMRTEFAKNNKPF